MNLTMNHSQHMTRALRLARRGEGRVEPNPSVGCVIVRDGRVVGEGWHRRFGEAHAEIAALRAAGRQARRATVYVTLEPCAHHGKTPPCTEALIEAGVGCVVVGCRDPHPAHGGGIAKLRRAGIEVVTGVCEDEATRLIGPFAKGATQRLPWVITKWATTVDGAMATAGGDSRWISNTQSRRLVHRLRARVDAILVGIGTALADDPRLTARDVPVRRIARRIVIDPSLRLPTRAKLLRSMDRAPLLIATANDAPAKRRLALEKLGAEVRTFKRLKSGRLNLRLLLRHLYDAHQATNVLVEGGGRTIGAMVEQNLVDELMVFIGPCLLGDADAVRPLVTINPVTRIARAQRLQLVQTRRLADDVLLRYRLG